MLRFNSFDAVQGFEAVDVLADGRRGHAQRGSGGVHAAVFEDGGENEQGFDVLHGVYQVGSGFSDDLLAILQII